MEAVNNDPVEYAQKIVDLLADVCYPVANSALKIADVLLEHQLNVQKSSFLEAGLRAVGYQSVETPPEQIE
jgi:hypothetical protein